jgi:DNA-binding transcriptional MerR regulator
MNTVTKTPLPSGDSLSQSFSLDELCALTDLSKRTVRYYVQLGLVNRPEGETRAAKYSPQHLEQLLLIKKWTAAGVSLDRIRELLQGGPAPVPDRGRRPGSLEVCSHLHVAEGIELVIEPTRAGLSPEQLRSFVRSVLQAYEALQNNPDNNDK